MVSWSTWSSSWRLPDSEMQVSRMLGVRNVWGICPNKKVTNPTNPPTILCKLFRVQICNIINFFDIQTKPRTWYHGKKMEKDHVMGADWSRKIPRPKAARINAAVIRLLERLGPNGFCVSKNLRYVMFLGIWHHGLAHELSCGLLSFSQICLESIYLHWLALAQIHKYQNNPQFKQNNLWRLWILSILIIIHASFLSILYMFARVRAWTWFPCFCTEEWTCMNNETSASWLISN